MGFYGELVLGHLTLTEDFSVRESSQNDRELQVSGQESWPPLADADEVRYRGEQLMAMDGQIVPVRFESKSDRNGFYVVKKPQVSYEHYDNNMSKCDWSVTLIRVGQESETVFESRLVGGNRESYYGGNVAERWHSPAAAHVGYFAGPNVPGYITRNGAEGALTVYRNIADGRSPRWGATPLTYLRGAVRIKVGGEVMTGLTCPNLPTDWSLENTLIKIAPRGSDTAAFNLSHYESGTFSDVFTDSFGSGGYTAAKSWRVNIAGLMQNIPSYVTILRNTPEECVVRTTYQNAAGYSTIDYALKRGAAFVSIFVQHEASTTVTVYQLTEATATNSNNGYIYRSTDDASGNRWVLGSAERINVNTAGGRIENTIPATSFGCFVGLAIGGGSAIDGNRPQDLAAQYLGTANEVVRAIHR